MFSVGCESCRGQAAAIFLLLKAIPKLDSSKGLATPLSAAIAVEVGEGGGLPGIEDFKMFPLSDVLGLLTSSEEDSGCCSGVGEVELTMGLTVGFGKAALALGSASPKENGGAEGRAALELMSEGAVGKAKDGGAVTVVEVIETGVAFPAGGIGSSVFFTEIVLINN